MRELARPIGAVLVALLLSAACGQPTPGVTPTQEEAALPSPTAIPLMDWEVAVENGSEAFAAVCEECHSEGGRAWALRAPSLVGVTERHSQAWVRTQILEGGGAMPSYAGKIDAETIQPSGGTQLDELIAYLGSLDGPVTVEAQIGVEPPDPQGAAAGSELFARLCQVCHFEGGRVPGEGLGITPPPPALTNLLEIRHSRQVVKRQILQGGGNMPVYGDQLSEQEAEQLLAYLMSLNFDEEGEQIPMIEDTG